MPTTPDIWKADAGGLLKPRSWVQSGHHSASCLQQNNLNLEYIITVVWCEVSPIGSCIWTHGPQLVTVFRKVMEPLRERTLQRKCVTGGALWDFIGWPHFLISLSASKLPIQLERPASCSRCYGFHAMMNCNRSGAPSHKLFFLKLFYYGNKRATKKIIIGNNKRLKKYLQLRETYRWQIEKAIGIQHPLLLGKCTLKP